MKRKEMIAAYDSVCLSEQEKEALLGSILSASDQGLTERKPTMKLWRKKFLMTAALIAALAIFMGCAVVALSTKKLKLDEYRETQPAWIDWEGQRHEATEVTKTVLSLQGLRDTPEQKAALEWYQFVKNYDPDHTIYMEAGGKFQAPEEYGAYNVYSQAMVDKLGQIAEKYHLALSGRKATAYSYDWKLGWDAIGVHSPVLSGTDETYGLRGCTFFESGNFFLWTDFHVTDPDFSWKNPTYLSLSYKKKGYMDTTVVGLYDGPGSRAWNYTRSDGKSVLIVVSNDASQPANDNAFIICDREDAFLYAQFEPAYYPDHGAGTREEMSDRDLEWLAEHIDFSIQPRKPDMDRVLPLLEKEDAEYDALLEQDNPFSQDCYGKLRKVLGSVAAYHLIDLDGDGKDECFFWDQNGNPQLYTMIDGKTAPVQTPGDKAFGIQGAVALCEGNVLKTYEEVGQAYQLYCFYTVDRGTLLEQNRLVYDIANDCWGLSLSGIHIDKALTKSEAEELLGSYVELPLEHLPIESFPDDT